MVGLIRKWTSLAFFLAVGLVVVAVIAAFLFAQNGKTPSPAQESVKVYWFIPDGLRADPYKFKMFEWADEGKLPNIKWMMDNGAYGYSIPDFPSHTPVNFATLLTGAHPEVHGIADGPMHVEGYPLDKPAVAGFSSSAKKVAPIWTLFENAGKKVAILSVPGSTPPEINEGIVIRGRWGGWGADTPALNFESAEKLEERKKYGRAFRLFYLGSPLTIFVKGKVSENPAKQSYLPEIHVALPAYGKNFSAILSGEEKSGYSSASFYFDGNLVTTLEQGETSEWFPVNLTWNNLTFLSEVRFTLIKLEENGLFRIRLFFNNINELIVFPSSVAREITDAIGPSVDFVDNWPNQLSFEPEDKKVFFDEAMDSLEWHRKAAGFIFDKYSPDLFVHDTYTPNQFLEARWWHRHVDENSPDFSGETDSEAWSEILTMYKGVDSIIGEIRQKAGSDTIIILSSDHGVAPLYRQVKLNNLFREKGWLFYTNDEKTGEPKIDWNRSKVIFLKMNHVYVNPSGLGGNYRRANGTEYYALRQEVIDAMLALEDSDGSRPIFAVSPGDLYEKVIGFESASSEFSLPADRVGDLVFQQKIGYQTVEEMDYGDIFINPLSSGYKQAIDPKNESMWTPFVIVGPGIRKGVFIENPIDHVDQMPTILNLTRMPIPEYVQGRVLVEILAN